MAILPWIAVPGLASHLLARASRRVRADWRRKYGHPVYLLETFVETGRFAGTCYRAANWLKVGRTKGRSRQDSPEGGHRRVPRKDVYLFPLVPRCAERLRASRPTSHPQHP